MFVLAVTVAAAAPVALTVAALVDLNIQLCFKNAKDIFKIYLACCGFPYHQRLRFQYCSSKIKTVFSGFPHVDANF